MMPADDFRSGYFKSCQHDGQTQCRSTETADGRESLSPSHARDWQTRRPSEGEHDEAAGRPVSVFRPQYKHKQTGELRHTKTWYYKFIFAGRLIKESAKTTSKTVAKEAEKKRRRELEEGFNGLADARDERIRSIRTLAEGFLKDYRVRQPKSASFADHAMAHVKRLLGDLMTGHAS